MEHQVLQAHKDYAPDTEAARKKSVSILSTVRWSPATCQLIVPCISIGQETSDPQQKGLGGVRSWWSQEKVQLWIAGGGPVLESHFVNHVALWRNMGNDVCLAAKCLPMCKDLLAGNLFQRCNVQGLQKQVRCTITLWDTNSMWFTGFWSGIIGTYPGSSTRSQSLEKRIQAQTHAKPMEGLSILQALYIEITSKNKLVGASRKFFGHGPLCPRKNSWIATPCAVLGDLLRWFFWKAGKSCCAVTHTSLPAAHQHSWCCRQCGCQRPDHLLGDALQNIQSGMPAKVVSAAWVWPAGCLQVHVYSEYRPQRGPTWIWSEIGASHVKGVSPRWPGAKQQGQCQGAKKRRNPKKARVRGKKNRFSVKISIRYPFQLLSYQAWRDLMTVAGWWNPFMFTDVDARGGELYLFKNLEAEPLGLKVSYTRQTTLVSRTVSDWDVCLSMFGSWPIHQVFHWIMQLCMQSRQKRNWELLRGEDHGLSPGLPSSPDNRQVQTFC